MSKRLKLLFVAAAVVAFCGVQVAQASAFTEFTTESTPTWVKGSQETQNVFTVSGGTVKCSSAEFESTEAVSTASTTMITIHPKYGKAKEAACSAFGQKVDVSTDSCSYTITISATGDVTVQVICLDPVSKSPTSILIHGSTTGCSVSVPSQTLVKALSVASSGSGSTAGVLVTASATGIAYTSSGGACGASGSNGTYSGSVITSGFKSASFTEQHGIGVK
jgi:hypothetical protein